VSKASLVTQMDINLPRIPRKKLAPCFDPTACEPVVYPENAPAWDMYAHWELEPTFETPKSVMRQIENEALPVEADKLFKRQVPRARTEHAPGQPCLMTDPMNAEAIYAALVDRVEGRRRRLVRCGGHGLSAPIITDEMVVVCCSDAHDWLRNQCTQGQMPEFTEGLVQQNCTDAEFWRKPEVIKQFRTTSNGVSMDAMEAAVQLTMNLQNHFFTKETERRALQPSYFVTRPVIVGPEREGLVREGNFLEDNRAHFKHWDTVAHGLGRRKPVTVMIPLLYIAGNWEEWVLLEHSNRDGKLKLHKPYIHKEVSTDHPSLDFDTVVYNKAKLIRKELSVLFPEERWKSGYLKMETLQEVPRCDRWNYTGHIVALGMISRASIGLGSPAFGTQKFEWNLKILRLLLHTQ